MLYQRSLCIYFKSIVRKLAKIGDLQKSKVVFTLLLRISMYSMNRLTLTLSCNVLNHGSTSWNLPDQKPKLSWFILWHWTPLPKWKITKPKTEGNILSIKPSPTNSFGRVWITSLVVLFCQFHLNECLCLHDVPSTY